MLKKDISKVIRANSRNESINRYCEVCGKENRVENHHTIKVEQLKNIAFKNDLDEEDIKLMYFPRADLCKQHHLMLHSLYGDIDKTPVLDEMEAYDILELLARIDLTQVDQKYVQEYYDVTQDIIENVTMNLLYYDILDDEEIKIIKEVLNSRIEANLNEENEI